MITEEQIKEASNKTIIARYGESTNNMPDFSSELESARGFENGFEQGVNWAIKHMQSNWQPSGYGEGKKCPFIDGEYYHCAYQGVFATSEMIYQGIFEWKDVFRDASGYYLKPFPSHFIHICKPKTT